METLAIDLPTVIRMVDASSPVVGIARARVREADARRLRAELQWLPNLSVGAAYLRFDGQTQNQRGEVFGVSRSNLFVSGGPALTVDLADAIYQPLIERRVVSAEQLRTRAVTLGAELDAIEAYLELVQAHALIEINADTTRRAEEMLKAATNARDAKLDRTAGDVNRARTEVLLRKSERPHLMGGAGVAAAWARFRKSDRGFLLPKLVVADQVGSFGGGRNDDLQDFEARNALGVQLYWELKNLGFGNLADADERRAAYDQARLALAERQAAALAEIVEAAQTVAARHAALALAEDAVREATELYRISMESTSNVIDAKNLFDALRPLQAIEALNQALAVIREQDRQVAGYGRASCSARSMARFFAWCAGIRRRISSRTRTAVSTCGPLLSITHPARWPMAASVISAREGRPSRARFSSAWVAQITGTWAAPQIQRISS